MFLGDHSVSPIIPIFISSFWLYFVLSVVITVLELEVLIKSCNNIANTFIIIGNHDFYYDKDSNTITLSHIWEDYDKLDNVYLLKDKSLPVKLVEEKFKREKNI